MALGKLMCKSPRLLGRNVTLSVEPKVNWLQQRLGWNNATLSKIVKRNPSILACNSTTGLAPTLDWLQPRLDLDDATLSFMIQNSPSLMNCNVDSNLEPTLNFYIDALESEEDALALVIRNPRLFSFSLDKRLRPRLEQARDAGIGIDVGCLKRLAEYTDGQWERSIAYQAK